MKDRVVQYPNRYKLTPVSGDIYDLAPQPGTITEPGTPINKASLMSVEVEQKYGLTPSNTVSDVFEKNASITTIQVPKSGWKTTRDSNNFVWQQVSVPNMKATFNPVVSLSKGATRNQKAFWEYVKEIETLDGSIILRAVNKILVDLTIEMKGV